MLEDSAPVVLLTQRHLEGLFAGDLMEALPVIDLADELAAGKSSRRRIRIELPLVSRPSIWPM